MRRFWVLLGKEVRELITPQILLPFAVTIVMFIGIGQLVSSQGAEAEANRRLALLDRDRTAASQVLRTAIEQAGFKVDSASGDNAEAAVEALKSDAGNILVVVPEGYGETIAAGKPATIDVYSVIRNFSLMSGQDTAALSAALGAVQQAVSDQAITSRAPDLDPAFVKQPLRVADHVIVGDRRADVSTTDVMSFITSQTIFVPIVLFVVVMFAAQMVGAAIATEKENKTLESLLAMPISRSAIVTAKMMAAGLVALLSAGAYMLGMNFYMKGMTEGLGGGTAATEASRQFAEALGLTFGVSDYVLLGLSMFASILVALAVAIILGAFAENVKSVQSLLSPLIVFLMVPYFMSMFIDINSLAPAARWAVLAIPFSHSFLAAPNLFLGDTQAVLIGVAYQTVWFVVLVVLAGRLFRSDRLLTMRLNFGSRKKRRTQ